MINVLWKESEGLTDDCKFMAAYSPDGGYIGIEEDVKFFEKMGIQPQLATPDSRVCSIGWCEKEQKWYGWSHRAISGFAIGTEVNRGDCGYSPIDKDDFLEETRNFWDDKYHSSTIAYHHSQDGKDGVQVKWVYNESVPNEKIRGKISGIFAEYPEVFGKGEWKAETLEDAKQMAIDFAEGVS